MGVTHLWQILAPVQQHRPLSSLAGQTLAVDLSIWVCETQSVKQMQGVVSKPFLRNLFFRISHLSQLGVHLVFVIEGTAPELKWETMMKRQQVQYGARQGGQGARPPGKQSRRNFNTCLKECCELLDILGIPYVQSCGEAEAMCAVLNAAGLVDGCLTNDGDAFLYGATKVYRNFTMNSKDPHVESYSITDIQDQLCIDRDRLIGLGLLLGCDYVPKGVPGVGVANAVKLLQSLRGHNILKRFKAWRSLSDRDCVDKVEAAIRRKALTVKDFPQNKVIAEFLVVKDRCPSSLSPWKRPHASKFQNFALLKLEWPIEYGLEKVLPLLTLWDLGDIVSTRPTGRASHLKPHRIVKTRVRQGVPCLEIEWHKPETDTTHPEDYYVTIETQELFVKCYPGIYEEFNVAQELKKTKKPSKGKSRKKASASNLATVDAPSADVAIEPVAEVAAVTLTHVDELSDSLRNLNLTAMCDHEIDGVNLEKPNLLNKDSMSNIVNTGRLFPMALSVKGSLNTDITQVPVQNSLPFNMGKPKVKAQIDQTSATIFDILDAECSTGIMGSPADNSVCDDVIPLHLRIMKKMNKKSEEKLKYTNSNALCTKSFQASTHNTPSLDPRTTLQVERNFSTVTNNGAELHENDDGNQKDAHIAQAGEMVTMNNEVTRVESKEVVVASEYEEIVGFSESDINIDSIDYLDGDHHRDIDAHTCTNISKGNTSNLTSPLETTNNSICDTSDLKDVRLNLNSGQTVAISPTSTVNEPCPSDSLCYNTPGNQTVSNVSYGHFHMSSLCNTLNFSNHSLLNASKITDTSIITEQQLEIDEGNDPSTTTITTETVSDLHCHISLSDDYQTDKKETSRRANSDLHMSDSNYKNNISDTGQMGDSQICEKLGAITLDDDSVIIVDDLNVDVPTMSNKLWEDNSVKRHTQSDVPSPIDVNCDPYKLVCVLERNAIERTAVDRVKNKDFEKATGICSETRSKRNVKPTRKSRKYLVEKASPLMDFSDDDDENMKNDTCNNGDHTCNNGADSLNHATVGPSQNGTCTRITGTAAVGAKFHSRSSKYDKKKSSPKIKKTSPVMDFSADNTVLMDNSEHHVLPEKDNRVHKPPHYVTDIGHSASTKPANKLTLNSSKIKRAPIMSLNKAKISNSNSCVESRHKNISSSQSNLDSNVRPTSDEHAAPQCRNIKSKSVCVESDSPQCGNIITLHNIDSESESVEACYESVVLQLETIEPESTFGKPQLENIDPQSTFFKPSPECVKSIQDKVHQQSTTHFHKSDSVKGTHKAVTTVIKDNGVSLDVGSPVSLSQRLKLRLKDSSTGKVLRDFTNF